MSAPTQITMSNSSQPSRYACSVSATLIAVRFAPRGKPITVQTFTSLPASSSLARGT